ncbi:MAG: hypothetical protein K6U89_19580 [Chloroflexi bacterium]|nr:hypothetical protein [Chloroflexota bacterium]
MSGTGAPARLRLAFLVPAFLALLAALWAGLQRLGWDLPALRPGLAAAHGPLMISGFLGTLIALERAVALGSRWAYGAPALAGLGGLALLAGLPDPAGALGMTLGSAGLAAIFGLILYRHPALHTATLWLGALSWLGGNTLWLAGQPLLRVVPWWTAFLVLTIAGERLELARLLRLSRGGYAAYIAAAGALLAGLAATLQDFSAGTRMTGLALTGLALWLWRYDIARRRLHQGGLTRFIAVSLLAGYVWLAAGGLLALVFGDVPAGPRRDAMLHAVFVGFVFSMIFGHAPVIFPGVLGRPVVFRPHFYAHLVLLHASLLLRVTAGVAGWMAARQWGGLLNAAAVLLFLAVTASAVLRAPSSGVKDRISGEQ